VQPKAGKRNNNTYYTKKTLKYEMLIHDVQKKARKRNNNTCRQKKMEKGISIHDVKSKEHLGNSIHVVRTKPRIENSKTCC
jgi:hypothetical protein